MYIIYLYRFSNRLVLVYYSKFNLNAYNQHCVKQKNFLKCKNSGVCSIRIRSVDRVETK